VGDRLAAARLAQAYQLAAPERRRMTSEDRSSDERQRFERRVGGHDACALSGWGSGGKAVWLLAGDWLLGIDGRQSSNRPSP
jgi:hypothetical protein